MFRDTLLKKFELNKKTNAEFNLELLLLREKNVSK